MVSRRCTLSTEPRGRTLVGKLATGARVGSYEIFVYVEAGGGDDVDACGSPFSDGDRGGHAGHAGHGGHGGDEIFLPSDYRDAGGLSENEPGQNLGWKTRVCALAGHSRVLADSQGFSVPHG